MSIYVLMHPYPQSPIGRRRQNNFRGTSMSAGGSIYLLLSFPVRSPWGLGAAGSSAPSPRPRRRAAS
eukprot:8835819-Pyramimonas_sp.AAC.1